MNAWRGGLIRGHHARLDTARLGRGVTAFVHSMLESRRAEVAPKFEAAVKQILQIVARHDVSGAYDFLLQVVARDRGSFGDFARNTIRALPGVKEMNSSFSLKEVKAGLALPVG